MDEYVDGDLDAQEQARVERHAQLCPPCHRLVATLRATLAGLRGLGDQSPPGARSDLAEAVIGRLRDSG